MNTQSTQSGIDEDLARQHVRITGLALENKVRLLSGATAFTLPGDDTLGLAPLAFSDGPTGVRGLKFAGGDPVCLFPNATLISGSWDDEIAAEVGAAISDEARRQGIHVVLGPTINLHRSPLGGRLFEAYSEDPYLTGRTAAAYVRAMQARGTAACLKHLIANESETLRNFVDSRVSERTLREVYLLPFEIAAQDAHAWTMMAAYNDINGIAATEHHEVQHEIAKREWDWDGLIMSDWFAVKSTVASANGGLDLVMPGPEGPWGQRLVDAVQRGEVCESTIDEHLARVLLLAERTGALASEEPPAPDADCPAPDSSLRRAQLRRIAARGMVLVKNDHEVLPLDPAPPFTAIGRHVLDTQGMGGGSAQVRPPHMTSVADALTSRFGDDVSVLDGVEVQTRPVPAVPGFLVDPVTGEEGMRVTYFAADGTELASRHEDGTSITLGWDDDFAEAPTGVSFTARLCNRTGSVRLGGIGAGTWSVSAEGRVLGQEQLPITGFDPAEAMLRPPSYVGTFELPAEALATVRLDIAGVDWAEMVADHPKLALPDEAHLLTTGSFGAVSLVAEQRGQTDDQALACAEDAVRSAGTAVVVVGLTEEDETEAADKSTLRLPGRQDELVHRIAAVAERTVVVVNAATPVLMPWLAEVDAVLIAGLPGQEAGDAIVDILTGVAEPTGRLVTSYPQDDGAAPAWRVTPGEELAVTYDEGPFLGYRGHHEGRAPEPLFWFGHGLGYATWEYREARLLSADDAPVVEVGIANTGIRSSRETVQVYYRPADRNEPVRLVGYAGEVVEPESTANVVVRCDGRLFRRWNASGRCWQRLSRGELLVGRSIGDIRAHIALD